MRRANDGVFETVAEAERCLSSYVENCLRSTYEKIFQISSFYVRRESYKNRYLAVGVNTCAKYAACHQVNVTTKFRYYLKLC